MIRSMFVKDYRGSWNFMRGLEVFQVKNKITPLGQMVFNIIADYNIDGNEYEVLIQENFESYEDAAKELEKMVCDAKM